MWSGLERHLKEPRILRQVMVVCVTHSYRTDPLHSKCFILYIEKCTGRREQITCTRLQGQSVVGNLEKASRESCPRLRQKCV